MELMTTERAHSTEYRVEVGGDGSPGSVAALDWASGAGLQGQPLDLEVPGARACLGTKVLAVRAHGL